MASSGSSPAGDDVEARERAGRVHGLELFVETLGARDRLADVLAALSRRRVGIVLEPLQSLGGGQVPPPASASRRTQCG